MAKLTMEQIVAGVEEIPALPHIAIKVMQLTDDSNSTAQDINNVLNQDQAMTARVLKLANSAFYGFARRIGSVREAVIFLGFKTIRGIVFSAAVSDILNRKMEGYALETGELWTHSQASAMAARLIARKIKYPNVDLAFTAALLHDIGKVILNQAMQDSYHEVVKLVENEQTSFLEAENQVLGFNHAMVGAKVAEKWKLPPTLVEGIAYHHEPEKAELDKKLVYIVHLADFICISMGIGIGIDGLLYKVSVEVLENLNISELTVENIISELADVFLDL